MLKQLRQKKVMKRILWALAILIIPAFVLWGAGGLRENQDCAGMLFGKRVSFEEYRGALNAEKNLALLTYGSDFYEKQESLNLEDAAWNRLIMLKEAKLRGIKVSDNEVIAGIASFRLFQEEDGVFNQRTYYIILYNTLRTEPRKFEEEMRELIAMERLIGETIKDAPSPTEDEVEEALQKELEEETKKELEEKIKKEEEEKLKKEKKEKKKKKKGKKEKEEIEEVKKDEEKIEEVKETPEERRRRITNALTIDKRLEFYQNWKESLYQKADLISNIEKPEPPETPEEEQEE